jgi:hypothetical protein
LREEVEEREIDGVVGGGWKFRRREGGREAESDNGFWFYLDRLYLMMKQPNGWVLAFTLAAI